MDNMAMRMLGIEVEDFPLPTDDLDIKSIGVRVIRNRRIINIRVAEYLIEELQDSIKLAKAGG